jgi:hypothetical protein
MNTGIKQIGKLTMPTKELAKRFSVEHKPSVEDMMKWSGKEYGDYMRERSKELGKRERKKK